jgi:hypothetical protein
MKSLALMVTEIWSGYTTSNEISRWHYMTIIPPKDEKPGINGY